MNQEEGEAILSRANAAITWAEARDHEKTRKNWDDLVNLVLALVRPPNANNQDA